MISSSTMAKSRCFAVLLRLLAASTTVCATVVMATAHDSTTVFNLTLDAKFQYIPSFEFFVIANAVGCAYSLLALAVPPTSSISRTVIVFDVLIGMLLTAAVAAAGAMSELGKKGNSHAGWLPICGQIPKFCHQVMGALICGFVAAVVYLLILLQTFHTVISPHLP